MFEISEHNRQPLACRNETNVMTRYVSVGMALHDIADQGLLASAFVNVASSNSSNCTEKYSDVPPDGIRTRFGSFRETEESRGLRRRGLLSEPDTVTI